MLRVFGYHFWMYKIYIEFINNDNDLILLFALHEKKGFCSILYEEINWRFVIKSIDFCIHFWDCTKLANFFFVFYTWILLFIYLFWNFRHGIFGDALLLLAYFYSILYVMMYCEWAYANQIFILIFCWRVDLFHTHCCWKFVREIVIKYIINIKH